MESHVYIPKIAFGGLNEVRSLGYLMLDEKAITFVPQMSFGMKLESAWTNVYEITEMNIDEIAGLPFWQVIPTLSKEMNEKELQQFVADMAENIEGSCRIALPEINRCKVGLINLVVNKLDGEVVKINIGLGANKKSKIRDFLTAHNLLS